MEKAKQAGEQYNKGVDDLVARVDPGSATFQNFLIPYAHLRNVLDSEIRQVQFWDQLSPNLAIQKASREACSGAIGAVVEEHIKVIYDKAEELDPESQLYLESFLDKDCEPSSDRLTEISNKSNQIRAEFETNLNPEIDGLWFSKAELIGLRSSDIDDLEKGTGANVGYFYAKFRGFEYVSVMTYSVDPNVRKRVFIENENMVSTPRQAIYLPNINSAAKMPPFSRKQSFSAMNKRYSMDIQTSRHIQ